MQLALSTSPQIKEYLSHSRGIVIPLGSIEQHGPSGLIGTDLICAENIAKAAAEYSSATYSRSVLVAPAISYAPAQFNLDFAGSVSIRSSTLMLLLKDVVLSLAQGGFRHFYFLNGHGANIAPVRSLVHDLYFHFNQNQTAAAPNFKLKSWWEFATVNDLRQKYYGAREGIHATPSEISITQALYPVPGQFESRNFRELSAEQLQQHGGDNHLDAVRHRQQFPDGCVGSDPSLASAAHGKELISHAAKALSDDYHEFVDAQQ